MEVCGRIKLTSKGTCEGLFPGDMSFSRNTSCVMWRFFLSKTLIPLTPTKTKPSQPPYAIIFITFALIVDKVLRIFFPRRNRFVLFVFWPLIMEILVVDDFKSNFKIVFRSKGTEFDMCEIVTTYFSWVYIPFILYLN